MPKTIQEFFKMGLDRDIPMLKQPPKSQDKRGYVGLNLGPGKKKIIRNTIGLGKPQWEWPKDKIPHDNDTVDEIHAYQFFEHFTGEDALALLLECQRVLRPHGVLNIVVPYYSSAHMAQALDHKSAWSEETWDWLFGNEYYDDHDPGWKLKVHCCFIMGVVERNIDLFTQLVKEGT